MIWQRIDWSDLGNMALPGMIEFRSGFCSHGEWREIVWRRAVVEVDAETYERIYRDTARRVP